jgi:hypothetical protein
MQPASFGAKASARSPRLARSKAMEEIMRVLMRSELMRCTLAELVDMQKRILETLPELAAGSIERHESLTNLENIHMEQFRRALSPRGFSR